MFLLLKDKGSLVLILMVSAASLFTAIFSSSIVLNIIISIPVMLLIPGYLLLTYLYRNNPLENIEKLFLSTGLSVSIVALISFAVSLLEHFNILYILVPLLLMITLLTVLIWRTDSAPTWLRINRIALREFPGVLLTRLARYRSVLWILLLALTGVLLWYPVNTMNLSFSAIQSLVFIQNPQLFLGLLLVWFAILLFLAFSRNSGRNWGDFFLGIVFVMVFVNFWVVKTPYGYHFDSLGHMAIVQAFQTGSVTYEKLAGYYDFPGFHLFTSFLSQMTEFDLYETAMIIRILANILFTGGLYLFYTRQSIRSSYALGATIISLMITQAHHLAFIPHTLAFSLVISYLVLLMRTPSTMLSATRDKVIMMIMLLSATVMSFWHSMLFLFLSMGIYLIQKVARDKPINLSIIIIMGVALLTWELTQAQDTFNNILGLMPSMYKNLITGNMFATAIKATVAIAEGGNPWWAIITKYFWLFTGTVLGSFLWLVYVFRLKKLSLIKRIQVGAIFGVVLFSIPVILISQMGYYISRYQEFVRIFTSLLLTGVWIDIGNWTHFGKWLLPKNWKQMVAVTFSLFLLIMIVPTFLYEGGGIFSDGISIQDVEGGEYLRDEFGTGTNLMVYSNQVYAAGIRYYYIPESLASGPSEPHKIKGTLYLWREINALVRDFKNSGGDSIFLFSERAALSYSWLQVYVDDPRWIKIKDELTEFVGEENVWSNEYYSIFKFPNTDQA